MANVSKVYFSNNTTPLNSISTNRITSTFKINGGPREPGYYYLIENNETGLYNVLDLKPHYVGQLVYSNTVGDDYQGIQYAARLYLAVEKTASDPIVRPSFNNLKWVPIVNYYADSYLDPTTGKEWDPVATYVCDPPYLCPEP